jgi:hypothetical protein
MGMGRACSEGRPDGPDLAQVRPCRPPHDTRARRRSGESGVALPRRAEGGRIGSLDGSGRGAARRPRSTRGGEPATVRRVKRRWRLARLDGSFQSQGGNHGRPRTDGCDACFPFPPVQSRLLPADAPLPPSCWPPGTTLRRSPDLTGRHELPRRVWYAAPCYFRPGFAHRLSCFTAAPQV